MISYTQHLFDKETEAFKKDYHQHRSGVEGSLSALVRGHGMRVATSDRKNAICKLSSPDVLQI